MQKVSKNLERSAVASRDLLVPPVVTALPFSARPGTIFYQHLPGVTPGELFVAFDDDTGAIGWRAIRLAPVSTPPGYATLTSVGSSPAASLVAAPGGAGLETKSLVAGPNVTIVSTSTTVTISSSVSTVTTLPPPSGVASSVSVIAPGGSGGTINLKTLVAGSDVSITSNDPLAPNSLVLRYTGPGPSGSLPSFYADSGLAYLPVGIFGDPELGPDYHLRKITSFDENATVSITPDGSININSNVPSSGQIQVSSVGAGVAIPDPPPPEGWSEMPAFFFRTIAGETNQATVTATQTEITVDVPYTFTSETASGGSVSIVDPSSTSTAWKIKSLALDAYGILAPVDGDPIPKLLTPYVTSITTSVPGLAAYTGRFTYTTNAPLGQTPSFIYERGLSGLIMRVSQGTIGPQYLLKPLSLDFVTGIEGQAVGTRSLQISFTYPNNFGWVNSDGLTTGSYRIPHVTWVSLIGSTTGLPAAFAVPTVPSAFSIPVFFPNIDPHRITFDMSAAGLPTTGMLGRGRVSW